jgi:hypothetical protein
MEKNENKNEKIIDKLFKNCLKITYLLDLDNKNACSIEDKDIFELSNISAKLVNLFFSNYKYLIDNKPTKNEKSTSNNILLANDNLIITNSKFLINDNFSKIEFINFILYFINEYEFINDFVENLNKINKKYINITFKNITNICLNMNHQEVTENSHFLQSFHKLNINFRNIKKQVDSFINLSYKLNQFVNDQEAPIK